MLCSRSLCGGDYKTEIMDPGNKEVTVQDNFEQAHNELVFEETWWWAVHICLCAIAVVANTIFIVTVLYNR